jgi:hypothetical protein
MQSDRDKHITCRMKIGSLLGTPLAEHRSAAQPATLIRMQIQSRNLGCAGQNDGELQL